MMDPNGGEGGRYGFDIQAVHVYNVGRSPCSMGVLARPELTKISYWSASGASAR